MVGVDFGGPVVPFYLINFKSGVTELPTNSTVCRLVCVRNLMAKLAKLLALNFTYKQQLKTRNSFRKWLFAS